MTEELIKFETALLAKEKGFDCRSMHFYTKPNSKMFGVDEKDRIYPIKNTSKKLYKCGEYAALNIKNVYYAPTQSLLQRWIRDVHDIHIWCEKQHKDVKNIYGYRIGTDIEYNTFTFNHWTYEEALEKGLFEALKLIP